MTRTIALIDGFNFYHAIDNHLRDTGENLKWLNYRKLIESLCEKSGVTKVFFFTAVASHLGKDKENRHWRYIKALQTTDISIIKGNFKKKELNFQVSNRRAKVMVWKESHEEKETDVNIALTMLDKAYQNEFDQCLLCTADSDLVPAVKLTKMRFPNKRIRLIVPPGSQNISVLKQLCDDEPIYLRPEHFRRFQFPVEIRHNGKIIRSPYTSDTLIDPSAT